jgi:hypothetical protein
VAKTTRWQDLDTVFKRIRKLRVQVAAIRSEVRSLSTEVPRLSKLAHLSPASSVDSPQADIHMMVGELGGYIGWLDSKLKRDPQKVLDGKEVRDAVADILTAHLGAGGWYAGYKVGYRG